MNIEADTTALALRDAEVIAHEINYIKDRTRKQLLAASIEIGDKLAEAKALVPFGEWENWLKDNVDYSQSTANNLMRIAKEFGSTQISMMSGKAPADVFAELTYTQAVALLGLDMDARIELSEDKDLSQMSSRELEREVAARKAAEEKSQALDDELAETKNAKEKLAERIKELESELLHYDESDEESDMISRADADNVRIAAVEAARKEAADALEKAKKEAEAAKKKADELKEKLKSAEENASSAATDNAKKEYEAALIAADARARDLEAKLNTAVNPAVQRFAIYFDALNENYNKLLACVDDADETDRERLRGGIIKILDAMRAAV